jgi:hypothetical protein
MVRGFLPGRFLEDPGVGKAERSLRAQPDVIKPSLPQIDQRRQAHTTAREDRRNSWLTGGYLISALDT